jgi:NAD(P)-dependent dehydrogenase (short-subunit alcohol dehydrogenase family)
MKLTGGASRICINERESYYRMPNRIYLITGSTGIAAATARLVARDGGALFIVGNDEESCRALEAEIHCDYFIADITHGNLVNEAIRQCVDRHQRIDALFNVAGISGRRFGDGPVHECTDEGWDLTVETNLKSTFLMCREVMRVMLNQPPNESGMRGAILNMSSILAFSPEPKFFATHAYAASKSAITGLSRAMAAYYAPHKIRVNVIAPGLTRTAMSQRAQQNQAILDFMRIKQPLSEDLIDAEDVARAALFLLSDQARYITGEVLSVDAGWKIS